MLFSRQLFLIHSIWILTVAWVEAAPGLTRITATPQTLYLEGETDGSMLQVVERPPGTQGVGLATPTFKLGIRSRFEVALPRFDQGRDRLYSSFQTTRGEEGIGPIRFVDTLRGLSKNTDPFPASTSKKGLVWLTSYTCPCCSSSSPEPFGMQQRMPMLKPLTPSSSSA